MTIFQFKWLRRFVRRHTSPIPVNRAELWKRRLSIGYAIIAWQAFGFVCYMIFTGRNDWAKYHGLTTEEEDKVTPAQRYAAMFKKENAKILRYSGFTKVSEEEFVNKQEESTESTESNSS